MILNRNKLYGILIMACAAGYIWLFLGMNRYNLDTNSVEVCIIKHVTNIPCPSCGSTRSVMSLTRGDFMEALKFNPFGYIIAIILILTPLWITFDLSSKKKTLFEFYQKVEANLRNPRYAMPLILLILINWAWNIAKGL